MRYTRILKSAVAISLLVAPTSLIAAETSYSVTSHLVDQYKSVFATVESVDVVMARSRISGTVTKLTIDEGDTVQAGDVVAVVEDPKLQLQLVAVDARLESLRAQKKLAVLDLNRATQLRQSGAASQARLDESQTNVVVVDKTLKAMTAERKVTEQHLSESRVLAPTTGRVLTVNVTDGAVVLQGEQIATIAQEAYRLRMHLPERHARFLKAGDTVQVGQRDTNKPLQQGTVRQVYPQMDQGRVVADVEVPGLGDFFVGERTAVYVLTGQRKTTLIPVEYLIKKFGLNFVSLKDVGDVVVEPGRTNGTNIEILSGLNDGDVILSPTDNK